MGHPVDAEKNRHSQQKIAGFNFTVNFCSKYPFLFVHALSAKYLALPEGVGLVDHVPQSVPVNDHRDVEGDDLLQDQADPPQHGLVPAQAWTHNHTVQPWQPGVNLNKI